MKFIKFDERYVNIYHIIMIERDDNNFQILIHFTNGILWEDCGTLEAMDARLDYLLHSLGEIK